MEEILKKYKAIIFDMDGVIVDSTEFWKASEKKMLDFYNINYDAALASKTEAMSTQEAIAFWQKENPNFEINPSEIEQFVINEMINLIESNKCIDLSIKALIEEKVSTNYKLALATNAPKAVMEVVLKKAQLFHLFDVIITADDVKKVKPNPEIYLKVANLLEVSPSECLVFEDSSYGMQAAKSAGMHVVAYLNSNIEINRELYNYLLIKKEI